MKTTLAVLSVIAIVFGIATIAAGGRVLAGADPGYEVFRPPLIAVGAAWVVRRGSRRA